MTPLPLTKRQQRIYNRLRAEVLANAAKLGAEPGMEPAAERIRAAVAEVDAAVRPAHLQFPAGAPA